MSPTTDPSPHMAFDPFNPAPHQRIGPQTIRFERREPTSVTLLGIVAAAALCLAMLALR